MPKQLKILITAITSLYNTASLVLCANLADIQPIQCPTAIYIIDRAALHNKRLSQHTIL